MRNLGKDGFHERFEKFNTLRGLMVDRKLKLAEAITNDMGKTIRESIGEVEKSMTMIDYFVKNT
jgi:acyl-CoA reductase-like NAD-dependent aldehyde dehydrogenase